MGTPLSSFSGVFWVLSDVSHIGRYNLDELGSLLREAREAKGITLAEAQTATRINRMFLEALEDGRYETLPTKTHVKGYLRNYARYLGLDPQPILDRYELAKNDFQHPPPGQTFAADITSVDPIPPREDRVFFDPVNMELSGGTGRDSGSVARIIIILALLVTVALVANRFIPLLRGGNDGSEALTASIEEAVNNITNGDEVQATTTPETSIIAGGNQPITSTARNDAIRLPTPTATRPTLPGTMDTIRLNLEVLERAWMRVTIDNEVVFEGLVRRGDEPYFWEAQEQAQLLTGNGAGLFVTINDIPLGRLGGRAEVVDETWTTTSSGQ